MKSANPIKFTIEITGVYASSAAKVTGSRKEVLKFLRNEALDRREVSRKSNNLLWDVHSLPRTSHVSELVTMASFEINRQGIDRLVDLLSKHGVLKYKQA